MSKSTTKIAIAYALKSLLEEQPFNKISVGDIAARAGINRQTFYYHFRDIYDLTEWICLEEADKVIKDNKTHDTWQKGYLDVFLTIQKEKNFVMNVYRYAPKDSIYRYLYSVTYNLLYGVVEEIVKNEHLSVREEDKSFIANFFKYSFVGIVLEWMDKDMQEDPRLIVKRVDSLIMGTMEQSLHNANYTHR